MRDSKNRFSELGPRLLTGVLYGAATLGALWWGSLPTAVVFGLFSGIATYEFHAIRRQPTSSAQTLLSIAAAVALPIVAAVWGLAGTQWVVVAVLALLILRHTFNLRMRLNETAALLFGTLYVGLLMSHFVLVRELEDGLALALTLIASVWAADVAAYLFGTLFGRHKLAPRVSPKKSWEGFLAGVAVCMLAWAFLPSALGVGLGTVSALSVGLAVALAALVGDLFESRLKREVGVKDSGTILPGHGGFLDRIDSLLVAGLVAYWALIWAGVR